MPVSDVLAYYDIVTAGINTTNEIIVSYPPAHTIAYTKTTYQKKYRRGVRNARHKQQIIAGSEATTQYECFFRRYTYQPAQTTVSFIDSTYNPPKWRQQTDVIDRFFRAMPVGDGALDATSDALAKTIALEHFLKNLDKTITSFQGGVVAGEIKETLALLRHPIRGIVDSLNAFVTRCISLKTAYRRRKIPTRKLLEKASELWLEVAFGWRPLFSDIQDLCDTLVAAVEHPPDRIRIAGRGTVDRKDSRLPTTVTYGLIFGGTLSCEIRYKSKFIWKFYGAIDARPMGGVALDKEKFGFGPRNFLPTVWELIPYSFLADYFTNIGDLISAVTLFTNRVRRCATVRRTEQTAELGGFLLKQPTDGLNNHDTSAVYSQGAGWWNVETYDRNVYLGILIPDFRWKIPVSINQYVNMAALLVLRNKALPFKSVG